MNLQGAHRETISEEQVAIVISHGGFGCHAGLLFKNSSKETCVLHLAWHKKLEAEIFPGNQNCWIAIIPNLPKVTAKVLVGNLRKIAKKHSKSQSPLHIEYGVKVLEAVGSFSINGDYKATKKGNGLTCATFVTELLRAVGLPILDEKTWPEGANQEWIDAIANELERSGADADHVASVRNCTNARRILPTEVAAGANLPFKEWPGKHDTISLLAPAVFTSLTQLCPRP